MPGHTQRTVPRPHSRGSKQVENSALGCRFSACSWSSLSDAVHMNVWRHILHTIVCAAAFTFSWLCADDLAAARFRLRSRFCLARFPFPDGILMSFCSSRTTKKHDKQTKKMTKQKKKQLQKKSFSSLFFVFLASPKIIVAGNKRHSTQNTPKVCSQFNHDFCFSRQNLLESGEKRGADVTRMKKESRHSGVKMTSCAIHFSSSASSASSSSSLSCPSLCSFRSFSSRKRFTARNSL